MTTERIPAGNGGAAAAPAITVLMPAYNAATFLADALDSVLRQSFADFELLVIDDGSSDDTASILDACRDPRLRVLRNPQRLKLSGALNRGLESARGRWVARMDADDRMRPDRLARQAAFLDRHPRIGCCGGWVRPFGAAAGRRVMTYPVGSDRVNAFSLFYCPFAHPTVMFRREWFERHDLRYDGSYYPAEDYELWSRAVTRFPTDNLPAILLDYRIHAHGMTGGEWPAMDAQTVRVQQAILARLGLEPSPAQAQLHRQASMGQVVPSAGAFPATESWLLELNEANQRQNVYDADALAEMLQAVWFRMTMGVARGLGWNAWQAYRRSALAMRGPRARRRRWTVCLAACKAALLKGAR